METIRTQDLLANLAAPGLKLIDVRSADAYNGWTFHDEPRGGHIRGARSLPFKWLNYIDWPEIVRAKDILPRHEVIVYGDDQDSAEQVARQFLRAGYPEVRLYHGLVVEWMADRNLPMDRLVNYRHLVPAGWLDQLLKTGRAPEYDNDKYLLCHAHYRNRRAYEEGHIPGAVALDTNTLESSETWNRRSPPELKQALKALGIRHDTTVILYGRFSSPDNNDPFPGSSAGHLGAIRCAFILMYAGVQDVRVLNGGLQSWLDAGLPVSCEDTPQRPVAEFGAAIPGRPELIVDLPEAREILQAADKKLVSVRSWREFIGEVSGYNYIEKKGRIPGAVFGNCGSDAYHMENYRNLDHTTREYHEIERMWAGVGVTAATCNAFYCGTGWRGSEAFFNAWLMGWPRICVYDGGWFEWSRDENNPCETGDPRP
jgi:thiosulfate/3-mercaptopyruvate sulfurtransferase